MPNSARSRRAGSSASRLSRSARSRGFLTGALRDPSQLDPKDLRRNMPRFQPEHYKANLELLDAYAALAREAGCTMAQLGLPWLLEHVIALTGTTKIAHLEENLVAAGVTLSDEIIERLDALINEHTVVGARYVDATLAEIDTAEF
jgi:aryl-alcohol dehydrogenase-like predicted oxidoreductase